MMRVWRAAVLLGLAGFAFVAAAAGGGKTAWFLAGSLIGLAAAGITAGLAIRDGIAVERVLPAGVLSAGDALRIGGTVSVPFRFPLVFVLMADEWVNERTGRTVKGAFLLAPMGRRRVSFGYRLRGLERGVYRLVRTEVTVADFLDLAGFRRKVPAPGTGGSDGGSERGRRFGGNENEAGGHSGRRQRLPGTGGMMQTQAAEAVRFVVGPVPAELPAAESRMAPRPDYAAVGGVRLYAEGDPPSRIDWRSSMRAGRLMVKTPDADDGRTVCVLIDPGGKPADFERALGAAAACIRMEDAAFAGAGSGERDVLVPGDDGEWLSLRRDGRDAILRRLALMEPGAAGKPETVPDGSRIVVATGRLDRGFVDGMLNEAGADPGRVLALPGGEPGETERREAGRLRSAGIDVVFARAPMPPSAGNASRAPAEGRRMAM